MPIVVVGVVADDIGPVGDCAFIEFWFDIGEGAKIEEVFVGVAIEVDGDPDGTGGAGLSLGDAEPAEEADEILEQEGPVVVHVVAEEPVGGRGLWGDSFEGGVTGHCTEGGISAGVADAPEADSFVIIGDIVDEKFDGIVGVGGFIDVAGVGGEAVVLPGVCELRAEVFEDTFRHVFASNILEGENVTGFEHAFGASEAPFVGSWAVGAGGVGGAFEEDWAGLGCSFGHVNAGVQFCPVAHGDHIFVLLVGIGDGLGSGQGGEGQYEGCNGQAHIARYCA